MPLPNSVFFTCPRCLDEGRTGTVKIGNQRTACKLCNSFHQAVLRRISRRLIDAHPEEALELRRVIESDLYPNMVDEYRQQSQGPNPDDIVFDDTGQVIGGV